MSNNNNESTKTTERIMYSQIRPDSNVYKPVIVREPVVSVEDSIK